MTGFRTINTVVGLLVPIAVFLFLSKPDRGGVARCGRLFKIPELGRYELTHMPFRAWKPFESPKFRFAISAANFDLLAIELKRLGYSEWEPGGVQVDGFTVGFSAGDDHVCCQLKRDGSHHYWSYSAKGGVIYALTL